MSDFDVYFLSEEARFSRSVATVGVLTRYAGAPPSVEQAAAAVADRFAGLPRLRLSLDQRFGRRPRWAEGDVLDVGEHVAAMTVGPGEEDLLRRVGRLLGHRFAAGPPPWRLDVLSGYAGNEFALLLRAHHALVDGASLMMLMHRLLQLEPPSGAMSAEKPERVRSTVRGLASTLADFTTPGGRLPIDVRPTAERRLALAHVTRETLELARGPRAGSAKRPTLNDVFLAAVAGTLHRMYGTELPRSVHAFVPTNLRRPDRDFTLGNCLAPMRVRLPVTLREPADRLAAASAATSRGKARGHAAASAALAIGFGRTGTTGRALLSRLTTSQSYANLICSNVPIPQEPLAFAGRPLTGAAGMTVLPPPHGLALTLAGVQEAVSVSVLARTGSADLADRFAKELTSEFQVLADLHR